MGQAYHGEPTPIGFLLLVKIQLLFGVTLVTNNVENRIHMKVGRKIGNY